MIILTNLRWILEIGNWRRLNTNFGTSQIHGNNQRQKNVMYEKTQESLNAGDNEEDDDDPFLQTNILSIYIEIIYFFANTYHCLFP